jgi:CSLREA domain-containing protein
MSRRQRKRREKLARHGRKRARHGSRIAAGTGLSLAAGLAAAPAAQAVDFTVNTGGDAGDGVCDASCTLRDAVDDSSANNNAPTQDRVLFSAGITGTITLNGTQLPSIDEPLSIEGPGAGTLTVSGNNLSRILLVDPQLGDDVAISGLTLTGGSAPDVAGESAGGAIDKTDADLTVQDAVITGNSATGVNAHGGGIDSNYGSTTVERSTISGNSATGTAVYPGYAIGGGIFVNQGTAATIRDSTISGNSVNAYSAYGGGANVGYVGTATLQNSTVSGNSANGYFAFPGGLFLRSTSATLQSATISNNSASSLAGGIGVAFSDAQTVLDNTIVANNTAPAEPDLRGIGTANDDFNASFSLVETPPTAPTQLNEGVAGSNVIGQDPQLGPLADNGGPTRTHAFLFQTSPALDKGRTPGGQTTDQRGTGFPRPFDLATIPNSLAMGADGADIGAFEAQALPPSPPAPPPGPGPGPTPTPTPTSLVPTPTAQSGFDLKAAIKRCKKKFPKGPKRKRCIRKAQAKA